MHFFNAAAIFSFSSPLNMLTILGSWSLAAFADW
jgi:hypothetical protein